MISLAIQVRREKISERMKFLQDLVPGCSKVSGLFLFFLLLNYLHIIATGELILHAKYNFGSQHFLDMSYSTIHIIVISYFHKLNCKPGHR
jgi:hypothetical protein